jgi:transcriptional regulator with XRE-family HTH domain
MIVPYGEAHHGAFSTQPQPRKGIRAGYHRTYIGQLVRGEKSPSLRTLFNLSSTLQVNPSVLIRRVEQSI